MYQWRMNDFVYFKVCKCCGIKVEWQHDLKEENTLENFEKMLLADGWKKNWLGWWSCKFHQRANKA